jgi:purine-cytosine permease-like protein
MSTAAGSIGYQGGLNVGTKVWAPIAGVLVLLLSAALLAALFTAPAQPARVIERGVPIGRVAAAQTPAVAELGAVLTQAPEFTAASGRALNRGTATQPTGPSTP